jgi:ribosomal protein S18 acetylase RimI-like enzyme
MDSIMELERAAALHWRGVEEEALGEWVLRAAEGFTGRANSVLAAGDPGMPLEAALGRAAQWYRSRGLPPMVQVAMALDGASDLDGELAARGWGIRPGAAYMMTADLAADSALADMAALGGGSLRVEKEITPEWLAMHRYRGQAELPPVRMKVLTSAPEQVFLSIVSGRDGNPGEERDRGGETAIAVARLSFGGGWAGITSVEVDSAQRRLGLGTTLTRACRAEAFAHGTKRVFLQVETDNEAARALYERCGFGYSHRYHYRILPA